jgi:hypothetical protein
VKITGTFLDEIAHDIPSNNLEFSHFMSPQSCWPAAGNLFRRYCEHFGLSPLGPGEGG